MAVYTDALGRQVEVDARPERIVSLVPSLTEALFAFGAGDRVVGVTRYCVEPAEGVREKPKVGGTKNVGVADVIALAPDLVIANVEENRRCDVDALISAGLTVFVTYPRTVAGAIAELRVMGQIAGMPAAAEAIAGSADAEVRDALADDRPPPVRVFCPIWRNPWMTIGPDTYIHDLLRLCGGENVYGDSLERYPVITLGDAAGREPDVVMLPDEPYRFGQGHAKEVIAAAPGVRILLVDGRRLCWYGPRIADAIRYFRGLLREETDNASEIVGLTGKD